MRMFRFGQNFSFLLSIGALGVSLHIRMCAYRTGYDSFQFSVKAKQGLYESNSTTSNPMLVCGGSDSLDTYAWMDGMTSLPPFNATKPKENSRQKWHSRTRFFLYGQSGCGTFRFSPPHTKYYEVWSMICGPHDNVYGLDLCRVNVVATHLGAVLWG